MRSKSTATKKLRRDILHIAIYVNDDKYVSILSRGKRPHIISGVDKDPTYMAIRKAIEEMDCVDAVFKTDSSDIVETVKRVIDNKGRNETEKDLALSYANKYLRWTIGGKDDKYRNVADKAFRKIKGSAKEVDTDEPVDVPANMTGSISIDDFDSVGVDVGSDMGVEIPMDEPESSACEAEVVDYDSVF